MTSIETLRAVHHPTRRRILEYLYLHGPSRVGTLARELDEQVGSVSHHLRMLERADVVRRVPELATDGRTSWWRLERESISWSTEDFADNPADRAQAKAAERLSLEHQLGKLAAWKREAERADPAWRRAAFSSDFLAMATPEELRELEALLTGVVREWRARIEERSATGDGQAREPVFVFAHGFRSRV